MNELNFDIDEEIALLNEKIGGHWKNFYDLSALIEFGQWNEEQYVCIIYNKARQFKYKKGNIDDWKIISHIEAKNIIKELTTLKAFK